MPSSKAACVKQQSLNATPCCSSGQAHHRGHRCREDCLARADAEPVIAFTTRGRQPAPAPDDCFVPRRQSPAAGQASTTASVAKQWPGVATAGHSAVAIGMARAAAGSTTSFVVSQSCAVTGTRDESVAIESRRLSACPSIRRPRGPCLSSRSPWVARIEGVGADGRDGSIGRLGRLERAFGLVRAPSQRRTTTGYGSASHRCELPEGQPWGARGLPGPRSQRAHANRPDGAVAGSQPTYSPPWTGERRIINHISVFAPPGRSWPDPRGRPARRLLGAVVV